MEPCCILRSMKVTSELIASNASGALTMALSVSNQCRCLHHICLEDLKKFYVMWRNKLTVLELSNEESLPEHERGIKLQKIKYFEKVALSNTYTDTTIFAMRPRENTPVVIIDGIHRSIGIVSALKKNTNIQKKINLRMILFEGKDIEFLQDYCLSVPSIVK